MVIHPPRILRRVFDCQHAEILGAVAGEQEWQLSLRRPHADQRKVAADFITPARWLAPDEVIIRAFTKVPRPALDGVLVQCADSEAESMRSEADFRKPQPHCEVIRARPAACRQKTIRPRECSLCRAQTGGLFTQRHLRIGSKCCGAHQSGNERHIGRDRMSRVQTVMQRLECSTGSNVAAPDLQMIDSAPSDIAQQINQPVRTVGIGEYFSPLVVFPGQNLSLRIVVAVGRATQQVHDLNVGGHSRADCDRVGKRIGITVHTDQELAASTLQIIPELRQQGFKTGQLDRVNIARLNLDVSRPGFIAGKCSVESDHFREIRIDQSDEIRHAADYALIRRDGKHFDGRKECATRDLRALVAHRVRLPG